ncbi:hypothetical protein FACS1894188_06430 [Clostridia bacterium]|nr:hypothetical protein FACS1894188_06430 [Clostridia bacterium]
MKYEWLDEYCLGHKHAVKDFKEEWNAARYMVGGDKEGKPIVTLKLEPSFGDMLRREFAGDIVAGYYMNKTHWNSLYLEGNVPDDVLRNMVDESYRLIFGGLTKKTRMELG